MSKGKKESQGLQSYLYYQNPFSTYARITNDLLKSEPFKQLPKGLQKFYLVLVVHSFSEEQLTCLHETLKEYHRRTGNEVSDFDISVETGTYQRLKNFGSRYFVFPEKHAKEYGYSKQLSSNNLKALIEKGFIDIFCFDKGHYRKGVDGNYTHDFDRTPTVYQFVDKWKR